MAIEKYLTQCLDRGVHIGTPVCVLDIDLLPIDDRQIDLKDDVQRERISYLDLSF